MCLQVIDPRRLPPSLAKDQLCEQRHDRKQAKHSRYRTEFFRSTCTGFSRQRKAFVVFIEINFRDAANLCSFAVTITVFSSCANRVVKIVLVKVGAFLRFKCLYQGVKGLWAHVWYVKIFSGFVFY